MNSKPTNKIASNNFSAAFEQMCNFVAVSRTGSPGETIHGLVSVCLLRFPGEGLSKAEELSQTIETIFGVAVPPHQIQLAVDAMEKSGHVSRPSGSNLVLSDDARGALTQACQDAEGLEGRVKESWLKHVSSEYPELPLSEIWVALRSYLFGAFRRHGMQAAALLDPTVVTPTYHEANLSRLLEEGLATTFAEPLRGLARDAISEFFLCVGTEPDRSRYITQLADGAFNFYSLEIDPAIAERFGAVLEPLVLFLDTNFLFGILELHHNQQVDVSHELIRAINEHRLPLRLRYHQATQQELRQSIVHFTAILRSRAWPQDLSRAAASSLNLSGIEQRFHERNSENRLDVLEFLRPYDHCDVLLKEKGIDVYVTNEDRMKEESDLYHEYQKFLESNGKGDKPYSTVQHDAKLLDTVRNMRTKAASSLEAGALLVTCDYYLYRFDLESARKTGHPSCVVLPNTFWQILRPYIPSDQDFEKSFAETFALPEFRAIGSGGSKACSRMLSVLASYRDVPEETAEKFLSNDALLDRLRTVDDDDKFREIVDSEIVDENASLIEERAARKAEIESLREDSRKQDADLRTSQDEKKKLSKRVSEIEDQLEGLAKVDKQQKENLLAIIASKKQLAQSSETKVAKLETEHASKLRLERQLTITRAILAGVLSAVVVFGFLWAVNAIPWVWLRDHPRSIALRICFSLIVVTVVSGLCVPKWRSRLWGGSGFVALVLLALGLIET